MRLKNIVLMVLLCGVAFASAPEWTGVALTGLFASLSIIGIIYMLAIGFSLNDLRFLANEEFYQLIVTALMIAFLFGAEAGLNNIFSSIAPNLQDAGISTIDNSISGQVGAFGTIKAFAVDLVPQSTKSMYCGLNGAGFSVAPCGSFSALIPPITLSLQALGLSIAELSSLRTLASFGKQYAFTMLLPIGILFRTLRFTRGAGALFIGLAVSLYLFLPLTLIFMDEMTALDMPDTSHLDLPEPDCNVTAFAKESYNPLDLGSMVWSGISSGIDTAELDTEAVYQDILGTAGIGSSGFDYTNAARAVGYLDVMIARTPGFLYLFLVRGTLLTAVSLMALFTTFKYVSKLAGAEVDISALMRIA